jgi:hypothetical protein
LRKGRLKKWPSGHFSSAPGVCNAGLKSLYTR